MEIKLKLKIKDVEIELSQKEAEELRDLLGGLVGKEVIRESYPSWPSDPWRPILPWYTITIPGAPDNSAWTSGCAQIGNDVSVAWSET